MASPALRGLIRSLRIYHGPHVDRAGFDALYAPFVMSGTLVFDGGAHVGSRLASFRRLGARVVAFEPQSLARRALRLIFGADAAVVIRPEALAQTSGSLQFRINSANPMVSTASDELITLAAGADAWREQIWDRQCRVPAMTLDQAIDTFGEPEFIKLDLEGFELEALSGLSRPVRALSFEFTILQRHIAIACIDRLSGLGAYKFNCALGEAATLVFTDLLDAESMTQYIASLPTAINSGDIYAVLVPAVS